MMRVKNWQANLSQFVKEHQNSRFQWGVNDCCLFAANAIFVTTGIDIAEKFRGKYKTEIGAKRALIRYGKGTVIDTFTFLLGEPIARLNAMRGDIAAIETETGDAVGVVLGAHAIYMTPNGVTSLPLSQAKLFWSADKCHQS